jgi:rubrerythrin
MKVIRAEYKQKSSDVAASGGIGWELLGKRKLAGTWRANKKRKLAGERDEVLAPYEALNFAIDSKLAALDNIKLQLSNFVAQVQTEERVAKQTARASANGAKASKARNGKVFCPQCGMQVESGDRFCRTCGHNLSPEADPPPSPTTYPPGHLGDK